MSKPAGTKSYVSMTLAQLAELHGPNDLIPVQRVHIEKCVLAKAMSNFAAPQVKDVPAEPSFVVENFEEPDESLFAVESFEGENDK